MFSDISIHCVHFCAQTTKEIHLTHHTSDLLDYSVAYLGFDVEPEIRIFKVIYLGDISNGSRY